MKREDVVCLSYDLFPRILLFCLELLCVLSDKFSPMVSVRKWNFLSLAPPFPGLWMHFPGRRSTMKYGVVFWCCIKIYINISITSKAVEIIFYKKKANNPENNPFQQNPSPFLLHSQYNPLWCCACQRFGSYLSACDEVVSVMFIHSTSSACALEPGRDGVSCCHAWLVLTCAGTGRALQSIAAQDFCSTNSLCWTCLSACAMVFGVVILKNKIHVCWFQSCSDHRISKNSNMQLCVISMWDC